MKKIKKIDEENIWQTYKRHEILFVRGEGSYLYDNTGKKYLDFLGGIATCTIGHSNKELVNAISKQASRLITTSNLFYTEEGAMLARELSKMSGLAKCFFSNSGTEAVEAALKLARKYTGKNEIIAMEHGFHGRTFGSLAATWEEKYKTPFGPMLSGFKHVPFNNIQALEKAITKNTGAVILEPIQGEAGVRIPDRGYLKKVSALCRKKNVLLIVDEVQSGMGRTGKFLAFQHEGVHPDIVTMAKGLGNGVPIGATLARKEIAESLTHGMHGSTFGGNPLCTKTALTVIEILQKKKLIRSAEVLGKYFLEELNKIDSGKIKEIRGKGLMVAIELHEDGAWVVDECARRGLIINCTHKNVLRFLPALTITKAEIKKGVLILKEVLE